MPLLEGFACPAALALAFSFTRGGAGYARSPQPLPVGTRSPSLVSGANTCAANAVDVTRQSSPAVRKSDWVSLRMKESPRSRAPCTDGLLNRLAAFVAARPKAANLP